MSLEPMRGSPFADYLAKALGVWTFIALAAVTAGAIIAFGWNTFVAPLGVSRIGIVQAIGIDVLLSFIVFARRRDDKEPEFEFWKAIKHVALVDALAFSLLWLTAQFL